MQALTKIVLGLALAGFGSLLLLAAPAQGAAAPAGATKTAVSGELIDLNTAPAAELAALPGMGVVYAQRVVEGRPYSAKNQLVTRGVLPATAYERIKDHVVAHRAPAR